MKNKTIKFIDELMERYPKLITSRDAINDTISLLIDIYMDGNKVLICGNGGSAADCEHVVGELMKGFILKRKISNELSLLINDEKLSETLQYGLPTISLVSQTALATAFSNDQLPEAVFAQQVLGYGKIGDVLICISTSGESLNCIYAAKVARAIGVKVISLVGEKRCALEEYSDITIKTPVFDTYKVQEYHMPIYHCICLAVENEIFGDDE